MTFTCCFEVTPVCVPVKNLQLLNDSLLTFIGLKDPAQLQMMNQTVMQISENMKFPELLACFL